MEKKVEVQTGGISVELLGEEAKTVEKKEIETTKTASDQTKQTQM